MTAIDRFKYTGHDRSLPPLSVKENIGGEEGKC